MMRNNRNKMSQVIKCDKRDWELLMWGKEGNRNKMCHKPYAEVCMQAGA
jgi:hypothetical protein